MQIKGKVADQYQTQTNQIQMPIHATSSAAVAAMHLVRGSAETCPADLDETFRQTSEAAPNSSLVPEFNAEPIAAYLPKPLSVYPSLCPTPNSDLDMSLMEPDPLLEA